MSATPPRRHYLDWLRGLAVLIMIEAHLLDSWTRIPDRQTREFAYAMILGGFGAPLFLFLAGLAVSLSAGSKLRRTGDLAAASRAVARRGLEIFGLAFVFRLQAWILGWANPFGLLKVDILNIMGPSIAAAAIAWGIGRTYRARLLALSAATVILVLATPVIRALPGLAALPDALEAYIRPIPALSNFTFFPWAGFVFAGAVAGLVLDALKTQDQERRVNVAFLVIGLAAAWASYRLSFVPPPFPTWYPRSSFWTTSISFFVMRLGLMTAAIGAAFLWQNRTGGVDKWSPMRQLGRTSLFIYWIHVEMVYGLISLPLHKSLSWLQAWGALAIFSLFMLACSIGKDYAVDAWRGRGHGTRGPQPAGI